MTFRHAWIALAALAVAPPAVAEPRGPYARIAFLRPHESDTIDFEAGYVRHLEWHRQVKDAWTWYGWSIWAGERLRWFVYASFGHSAADFDALVSPAEDERDNVANVVPHAEFAGNGVYELLPALSRGAAAPSATPRAEMTTVDLHPGAATAFEAALASAQPSLAEETLWFRMIAGGPAPRYVRLRPQPSLSAALAAARTQELPADVHAIVAKATVEILTLRPTMSYQLPPAND